MKAPGLGPGEGEAVGTHAPAGRLPGRLPVKKTRALLIGWFVVSVVFLLAVEAFTLADAIPSNHITAVVRAAFASEPGVFMWLAFSLGYLAGHLFWSGREK